MKLHTVAALAFAVAAGGMGVSSDAWALAGGDPNATPCLLTGGGGNSMSGTMTIAADTYDGTTATGIDVTVRLQWKGKEQVVRAFVASVSVSSDAGVVCQLLRYNSNALSTSILNAFVLPPTGLNLNNHSITGISWDAVPGSGGHYTGIGEVVLYPQ